MSAHGLLGGDQKLLDPNRCFTQRYCTDCRHHDLIELVIPFDIALIAQLVERVTSNDEVAGSTPS